MIERENLPPTMISSHEIWLVIPAFNEDAVIAETVAQAERPGYSIVVVDDGSRTPVTEILRQSAATTHICRHLINLGQGAALQTGISYALRNGAKYIVTFDADGQHDVGDIPSLLAPLLQGKVDIALGTRFSDGGEAIDIPPLKRLILKLAVIFTRVTTGLLLTDTHNGFRAMSAQAASRIEITQNGMAHATQILLEIKRRRLRYCEIPVHIRYTEYSIKKGQRISNLFNILWESVTERMQP